MKNTSLRTMQFLLVCAVLVGCSKDNSPVELVIQITVSASDFTVTIDENPSEGQSLGMITGSTNMGSVVFSISNQTPAGSFSVDSSTGEISVADIESFNFEQHPNITGTVDVINGDVSKEALVTINLIDVLESHIYDGDVTLLTQEEVEIFGAENYTEITGWLSVGEYATANNSVTDLSPLSSLQKVGTSLYIYRVEQLNNLEGLQDLTAVPIIILIGNIKMTSIESLNGVSEANVIYVSNNDLLTDLTGLHNITGDVDQIAIRNNVLLTNIDALSGISSTREHILIEDNPLLSNINGLSGITSIGTYLDISNNHSLISLQGLNNLQEVVLFGITIDNNDLLENLDGLQSLQSVSTGYVTIGRNASLQNLAGLENLSVVKGLGIGLNPSLQNLNGLYNLITITDAILIGDNETLNDLTALSNLTKVVEIIIENNHILENLDGFDNLTYNPHSFQIKSNGSLTDFCSFENLFNNGGAGKYVVENNAYNPSYYDIANGDCSL